MKSQKKELLQKNPNHQNIIIAGMGLSGMIMALSLAKNNIKTTIIEKKTTNNDEFFNDIRTTALTKESQQFFQDIDIWDELINIAGPINEIYVIDNKSPDMIHFDSNELIGNHQSMGHLLKNKDFKKYLFKLVKNNKLITIVDNCEYEVINNNEKECSLKINQKKVNCDLLIVCDGKASSIKEHYFSKNIFKDYQQHALTFLVEHEKEHKGTAVEHFMPLGPFAILPLKEQNISSIVWTVSNRKKDLLLNITKEELTYIIQENFGPFLGKIKIKNTEKGNNLAEIAAFPLKAYITKNYFNKSIVLIADSAHIVHPLAGQGLNQGIKDIKSLSKLISEEQIVKELTLQEYEKSRKSDNNTMLNITDFLNSIFSNNSNILYQIRQLGFKIIDQSHLIKNYIVQYAMGKR